MKRLNTMLIMLCIIMANGLWASSGGGVAVTLAVDMNSYTGVLDYATLGVNVSGDLIDDWCGDCTPMDDSDGDGIYEVTVMDLLPDTVMQYKFVVGAWDDSDQFSENGTCTVDDGGFFNRELAIGSNNIILDAVCFSSCDICVVLPPSNDNICDAEMVAVGDTVYADNTDGTPDGIAGSCWIETDVDNDIWFTFVAPASGGVVIETIDNGAGNDDTQVIVFSSSNGMCTGVPTEVGCNDDIGGGDYMSLVEINGLNAGETYWVEIDGYNGTAGGFDLAITEAEPFVPLVNDAMCDAIAVTLGDTLVTTNENGTPDGPAGLCWALQTNNNDAWYTFVAPANGNILLETFNNGGDMADTQVSIYSSSDGTCTGDTMSVGCDDDAGIGLMSLIEASGLVGGDTYFVQINGYNSDEGEFQLLIQGVVEGDDICSATEIIVDAAPIMGDNTGATADGPQGSCFVDPTPEIDADVWFTFVGPPTGSVEIETFDIGGNNDTQIAVYTSSDGTCAGTLTEIGCGEDITTPPASLMSFVELSGLTPGDTYWVQVDGWNNTQGAFEIEVIAVGSILCPAPDAIICDNFDDYDLGPVDVQAAHWDPWSAGDLVSSVSDEQAFSNDQSLKIGVGGVEDNLLRLGDQTQGVYSVEWMTYIPTGATGYFNLQSANTPGDELIYQVHFNQDTLAPGSGNFEVRAETFTYPQDEWFNVRTSVDLDNDLFTLSINGVDVLSDQPYESNIGANQSGDPSFSSINFYSIDANNTMYIDDVIFDGVETPQPCDFGDVDNINMALICDDIESYTEGGLTGQSDHWSSWGGTATDEMIVTTAYAASGTQSVQVIGGQGMDGVLRLGNQSAGVYATIWKMYIPAGKSGYFNIQDNQEIDPPSWNGTVYFNDGANPVAGEGTIILDENVPGDIAATFNYPEDEWFSVVMLFDLDADILELRIDGELVIDDFTYPNNLGGINFYPGTADHEYYIDDVAFGTDLVLTVDELGDEVFALFPNPTEGIVTLSTIEKVESITVTNMLGAVVDRMVTIPQGNIELDLSNLPSGIFMVTVEVEGQYFTQRVMKN